MKRDWEVIKKILSDAEAIQDSSALVIARPGIVYNGFARIYEVNEHEFHIFYAHFLLIQDAGLAEVRKLGLTSDGPIGACIDRLTMQGHDFLEASRNETAWNKTKEAATKVAGISLSMFRDILMEYAKSEVKKILGLGI